MEEIEQENLSELVYRRNKSLNAEEEEIWEKPSKNANETEKRKMFGFAFEMMLKETLKNHVYRFNDEIRLQSEGCATGLKTTSDLADLYMVWWVESLLKIC